MGATKASQNATTERKQGLLDRVKNSLGRKHHDKATKDTAKNYIDHIEHADEHLGKMIQTKEADVGKETGKETENRKKVALLKTQAYHLEQVAIAALEYQDL